MPELLISPEKVGFLIEKAREFDVKEEVSDPDSGSNGADELPEGLILGCTFPAIGKFAYDLEISALVMSIGIDAV